MPGAASDRIDANTPEIKQIVLDEVSPPPFLQAQQIQTLLSFFADHVNALRVEHPDRGTGGFRVEDQRKDGFEKLLKRKLTIVEFETINAFAKNSLRVMLAHTVQTRDAVGQAGIQL